MHTFAADEHDVELISVWSCAWKEAGWGAKILTNDDGKSSPGYEYVMSKMDSFPSTRKKTEEYLAMSTIPEGGWFADPVIFPLYAHHYQKVLPNEGHCTLHEMPWLGLISARQTEWQRYIQWLVINR